MKCPECGSKNLKKFGKKWSWNQDKNERERKQQYQCNDCGRVTVNPITDLK